jgi:hypothetical protein
MDGWSNWTPGLNGNVGIIGTALHEIRFHAPYIDRMTDGSVAFLIAHELAHVRQFCLGKTGPRMKQALERDADAHARQWLNVSRCPTDSRAPREYRLQEFIAGTVTRRLSQREIEQRRRIVTEARTATSSCCSTWPTNGSDSFRRRAGTVKDGQEKRCQRRSMRQP